MGIVITLIGFCDYKDFCVISPIGLVMARIACKIFVL